MFSILYRFLKQFSPITSFFQKNVKHVFLFSFLKKPVSLRIQKLLMTKISHTHLFLMLYKEAFVPLKPYPPSTCWVSPQFQFLELLKQWFSTFFDWQQPSLLLGHICSIPIYHYQNVDFRFRNLRQNFFKPLQLRTTVIEFVLFKIELIRACKTIVVSDLIFS